MKAVPLSETSWVVSPHRVIYGDTDAMGIVYYGTYMRFLEIGRNEYVRARGGRYREIEEAGYRLPVTEVSVKYHGSAHYDDDLLVATRVEQIGRVQLRFGYRVSREGQERALVTGYTVHACLESASLKPRRLPPEILRWLPAAE